MPQTLAAAVAEKLAIVDEQWGDAKTDQWLADSVSQALAMRGFTNATITAPRRELVAAVRQCVRHCTAPDAALLAEMCVNLLAKGMRPELKAFVHPAHAAILSRLTPDEAAILLAFARRHYAPIVMRLELRYESLRKGLPLRHMELLLDDGLAAAISVARPAMIGAFLANLERLALLATSVVELSPAENPEHVAARAARGSPSVPVRIQFRRWLTGREVSAFATDEMAVVLPPPVSAVGRIQLVAKSVGVRERGRSFLHAVTSRAMIERATP